MTDSFVTVEQFEFLPEAQAIRMHLESEGIPAQLVDAETVSTEWALGNAIGYIKLQVPQSRAAEAKAILDKLRLLRQSRREADGLKSESTRCLSCDAELRADQATCPHCGWSYAEDANSLVLDEISEAGIDEVGRETVASGPDDESAQVLDSIRELKKPMIWLLLLPILAGFLIVVLSFIARELRILPPF